MARHSSTRLVQSAGPQLEQPHRGYAGREREGRELDRFVNYTVRPGAPGTPADEADVALDFRLSDVRNAGDLSDYTGELQARTSVRITDRRNGESESQPGTVEDLLLPATVQCAATSAATTGGACNLTTTLDAIWPGVVREGARSIWQLGQIEVLDGGSDGDVDTPGNAVFARQGIFIP